MVQVEVLDVESYYHHMRPSRIPAVITVLTIASVIFQSKRRSARAFFAPGSLLDSRLRKKRASLIARNRTSDKAPRDIMIPHEAIVCFLGATVEDKLSWDEMSPRTTCPETR